MNNTHALLLAFIIDRSLIWFYELTGKADKPCGPIQSWSRKVRTKKTTDRLAK